MITAHRITTNNNSCFIVANNGFRGCNGDTLERAIKNFLLDPKFTIIPSGQYEKYTIAQATDINQLQELYPELFI
jgi:hypothetical protein